MLPDMNYTHKPAHKHPAMRRATHELAKIASQPSEAGSMQIGPILRRLEWRHTCSYQVLNKSQTTLDRQDTFIRPLAPFFATSALVKKPYTQAVYKTAA